MLEVLIAIGRALALGLRGHRELVLENLALRQQLMGDETGDQAPPPAGARPAVLDRLTAHLEELAHGGGTRATRDRRGMASRLAPPPMDPTFDTPTEWPSTHYLGHARARP